MSAAPEQLRLLVGNTFALPQVNLLPPEIAEKALFRRVQLGLGAAVVAALGVVGLLYLSAASSATSAQGDLDTATASGQSLQAQSAKYSEVTGVYARAAAAQTQLGTAMGDEVRYSQLLNDLSLSVPSNVWLKSLSYTSVAAPAAGAAATAVPGATPGIGTLNVTGVAFSHDDVAVWLESIGSQKTYVNPYFASSTEALIGTRKVVNFTSTATVTAVARSGRYSTPTGP